MGSAATTAVLGCLLLKLTVSTNDTEHMPEGIPGWSYVESHNSSNWFKTYSRCGDSEMSNQSSKMTKQSPINIWESITVPVSFPRLQLLGHERKDRVTVRAVNLGHTAEFQFLRGNYKIKGGGLRGTFKLQHLHFHWGATSINGSEHHLNDRVFPLEMQMIYYNSFYKNFEEAAPQENGLAVLAFLFEITPQDNLFLRPLTDALRSIANYKDETTLPTPVAPLSILPRDLKSFFSYQGSLTTPPCYETVTWTIFKEPIKISEFQLDLFRFLLSRDREVEGDPSTPYLPLVNNFRPPQPLRNRIIFININRSLQVAEQINRASRRMPNFSIVSLVLAFLVVLKGSYFYQTKH